jgi:hypothetical protein
MNISSIMTREEFNNLLDEAALSKKEFCQEIGLQYNAVNQWGSNNRGVPIWVESWLKNYIRLQAFEKLRQILVHIDKLDN